MIAAVHFKPLDILRVCCVHICSHAVPPALADYMVVHQWGRRKEEESVNKLVYCLEDVTVCTFPQPRGHQDVMTVVSSRHYGVC